MDETFLEVARKATSGSSRIRPFDTVADQSRVRGASLQPSKGIVSPRVRLRLVEDNGLLEWEPAEGLPFDLEGYRGSRPAESPQRFDALELEFDRLPPSKITEFLSRKDEKLTPARGLRRFDLESARLLPAELPTSGRALVFIHGTFSNSENMMAGLLDASNAGAADFLGEAIRRYRGNVLTFDHPTLSVGPILNALDFQRLVKDSAAKIDLVCHSRGGLVARWWCETFDPDASRCSKVVFVGSPLAGTSLAAPPNIRNTIDLLTYLSRALQISSGAVALAVPVFSVVEALLRVVTSITSLVAKTPVADAAMAMVPGLFAMSRVGNNPELVRLLQSDTAASDRYHAVRSDFQPVDPNWKFWRLFRPARLADAAADTLFGGPNDLVVDTTSMTEIADQQRIAASRVCDFGESTAVHHLNYFFQPRTAQFLADTLL